jgi:hypothetical protein
MQRYAWLGIALVACATTHESESEEETDARRPVATAPSEVAVSTPAEETASAPTGTASTPIGTAGADSAPVDAAEPDLISGEGSNCGTFSGFTRENLRQPLDVFGSSPEGELQLTSAQVIYIEGLGASVDIVFLGRRGEVPFVVRMVHESDDAPWPPGNYMSGLGPDASPLHPRVRLRTAAEPERLLNAAIVIEEHEVPREGKRGPGTPIQLRGELEVTEPGWSLRVPFALSVACDWQFLLI